ncbi:hypothetical protein JI721_06795 [Alicyclobacillus cycloheptanicus]|uniref:Oligoendopeptidase F n=1 Tax=Alicyclobacillus cycloheptanicus TaxID=1457 RepID=A0ABT9XHP9_9BACL|nr:M3 family metallopeptidase [Alicyclobacillus cycloheptanicus]MDQ0189837.1 oligoendopeptidase F [Alicyclobacillus cycloheptanicus]WDM02477.1 hypothetical protein JI721_06795 [Alicyclobacillus cycloheptanicus]
MVRRRQDVPEEQVWNLTDLFADEAAFDTAILEAEQALANLSNLAQTAATSADHLAAYMRARDNVIEQCSRIGSYAMLKFSEDGTDAANQALFGRARQLQQQAAQQLTEHRDALLKLPEETLRQFANAGGALAPYRLYLTELADSRPHVLSRDAEAALSAVGDLIAAPATLYRTVTGADMKFDSVPDEAGAEFAVTPFSVMVRAEASTDMAFRRRAYDALIAGLKPYHNTLAVSLSTEIQKNVALAKLRGYASTADMLLHESSPFGDPGDNVPVSFFERVLDVILKELSPHMQRYARLRSRVWGVEKLHFSDAKAPIAAGKEPVPFENAARLIPEAVAVMGDDYRKTIERAFTERWIYRGDNLGALQGAYCDWVPDVHPYVFAPYHDILYDVFILAHELGHAGHGALAYANQVQQNRSSSRLFVEAPSTFHEHLLAHHLRQTRGDAFRAEINCMQLLTFHHNFVTHLIEAELLRRLYQRAEAGQPLTAGVLDQTQTEILSEFWGDTVELDEGAGMTWMRQAHYYSGLYPYTYSVGLTASTVLASRLAKGEDVTRKWLEVLKLGGSKHALELFKMVDIDMDSEAPYREAIAYVGRLIDELEEIYA